MERKALVLTSIFFLVLSLGVVAYFEKYPLHLAKIDIENQFTYGDEKAPVQIILFEEFACPMCQRFHKEDLPFIQETYIDTKKAKITIIPTAFLDISINSCLATICVFKQEPGRGKHFLDYIFQLDQETLLSMSPRELLTKYAGDNSTFSVPSILACMKEDYFSVIENNIEAVKNLYESSIHLPTIVINGRLAPNLERKTLTNMIEKELKRIPYDQAL